MNVLAIGAHPDDVEFYCAGTLLKYAKAGHRVFVALTTSGNIGSNIIAGREEIARTREAEQLDQHEPGDRGTHQRPDRVCGVQAPERPIGRVVTNRRAARKKPGTLLPIRRMNAVWDRVLSRIVSQESHAEPPCTPSNNGPHAAPIPLARRAGRGRQPAACCRCCSASAGGAARSRLQAQVHPAVGVREPGLCQGGSVLRFSNHPAMITVTDGIQDAFGFLGVHQPASEAHFHGLGLADGAGEPLAAAGPGQHFQFDPLPEGTKIKAIHCKVTDFVEAPKAIPFHFENLQLP